MATLLHVIPQIDRLTCITIYRVVEIFWYINSSHFDFSSKCSSTAIHLQILGRFFSQSYNTYRVFTINPRTAGGGRLSAPLRFFADSEKTAARSAAKFTMAIQPTIWHISKKTMTRWHQRSRLQVTLGDLTSSCVFRSLTSCQRHTSDPNSLTLAVYSKGIGVYNLYISDFWYRWP